ncbi:hypothetical protein BpHYR1_007613 [Brachionus plicatilis]|uniref:Uncharacterized protein n=1 Tax=Brachionus plicatilis TaxID=10195 RepID=A0A3M7QJN4_BRAPC|nr:hypothetical protein BpHYR1_005710 [Brachionus plicatilis]RNA03970.1 hypothetical protein BpHYR1_023284 [Brachionus plicatilis]RNA07142.1 hypothetical protein BpHYR1_026248 [Brachionus plicatilis]RNA11344.1 hypothetical protein BpHYR1_012680 [Brachionus plicatilis]RNA14558.1 hypothetical protein BpHYR1_007613 [Brachionus plicatilis]
MILPPTSCIMRLLIN